MDAGVRMWKPAAGTLLVRQVPQVRVVLSPARDRSPGPGPSMPCSADDAEAKDADSLPPLPPSLLYGAPTWAPCTS